MVGSLHYSRIISLLVPQGSIMGPILFPFYTQLISDIISESRCSHTNLLVTLHLHLSLNCEGHWSTTDNFTTSFLHFSLCLHCPLGWDLANSRHLHSQMWSAYLFFCLPCLLPPFTVPCKAPWWCSAPHINSNWLLLIKCRHWEVQWHCPISTFLVFSPPPPPPHSPTQVIFKQKVTTVTNWGSNFYTWYDQTAFNTDVTFMTARHLISTK